MTTGGGGGGGGSYYNPYTVTINGGATQTASANVTLALTTIAGMNQMWISNDPTFATAGSGWIPFQATYPWTLTAGAGYKTVYASFGNTTLATPAENAEASITVGGANASGGQVLGAATFRFTKNLYPGMTDSDVTQLQLRLTAEGVYSGPITGYYGSLTTAGVKAYQAKYGIQQTGTVGPLTRAQLNGSAVEGASTVNIGALQAQIASLQTQLLALLQQLAQMLQSQVGH